MAAGHPQKEDIRSPRNWVARIAAWQPSKRGRVRKVKPRPLLSILETQEDRCVPSFLVGRSPA